MYPAQQPMGMYGGAQAPPQAFMGGVPFGGTVPATSQAPTGAPQATDPGNPFGNPFS